MILLITGATHAGKTVLAQRLMEERHMPYLSLDHLKMGLIRAGLVKVTPTSPIADITAVVWPVAREMIRTCMENGQQLIVEGCYIPADWEKAFSAEELAQMRCVCIALSEAYIRNNWEQIVGHASDVEQRMDDDVKMETLIRENAWYAQQFADSVVIRKDYERETDALRRSI